MVFVVKKRVRRGVGVLVLAILRKLGSLEVPFDCVFTLTALRTTGLAVLIGDHLRVPLEVEVVGQDAAVATAVTEVVGHTFVRYDGSEAFGTLCCNAPLAS